MSTEKQKYAIRYAKAGFSIFPLHTVEDGVCSCKLGADCGANAGKHPRTRNGVEDATRDVAQVKKWWDKWPEANIGLSCSAIPGSDQELIVVDIDDGVRKTKSGTVKKKGSEELAKLEDEFGKLPRAVIQKTGSGGRHIIMRMKRDTAKPKAPEGTKAIDIKGRGGYIVVAPSDHLSGGTYHWKNLEDGEVPNLDDIPLAPKWLWNWSISDGIVNAKSKFERSVANAKTDLSRKEMKRVLKKIPNDEENYDDWLAVGFAVHHQTDGAEWGRELWREWSQKAKKHEDDKMEEAWDSFGHHTDRDMKTARYLIQKAQEHGWRESKESAEDRQRREVEAEQLPDKASKKKKKSVPADDDDDGEGQASDDDEDDGEERKEKPEERFKRVWGTKGLEVTSTGKVKKILPNVETILLTDIRFKGIIRKNLFDSRIVCIKTPWKPDANDERADLPHLKGSAWTVTDPNGRLWLDENDNKIRSMLAKAPFRGGYGIDVADRDMRAAVDNVSLVHAFHPVKDYLDGLEWDGRYRVRTMLHRYLGCENNAYTRAVSRLMMVAAVTRIYEPGHKFDFCPIIEGKQGLRKSTFIKVLAKNWFGELTNEFENKNKAVESMLGKWMLEIPELSQFNRTEVNSIKTFFSASSDNVRLAYDRRPRDYYRQCIFIGSTNEEQYLRDPTGNRRFWPIKALVKTIDTDKLKKERKQLWAEAVAMYRKMREEQPYGDLPLYLTGEAKEISEREQDLRRFESEEEGLAGQITAALDNPNFGKEAMFEAEDDNAGEDDLLGKGLVDRTCIRQIWDYALGGHGKEMPPGMSARIQRAMHHVKGWLRAPYPMAVKGYGKPRVYIRKD